MMEITDIKGNVVGRGDETTGTVKHLQGSRGMSVQLSDGQTATLMREGTITYITWHCGMFDINRHTV